MMANLVYLLCAGTALVCAIFLMQGYRRTGTRLLFWSSVCFGCMGAENVLLFFDLVVTGPALDLKLWRNAVALLGLFLMLYGLVWEPQKGRSDG